MNVRVRLETPRVIASLLTHKGKLSHSARELGCTTMGLRMFMNRHPEVQEAYQMALDELVDDALEALRNEIHNGNTRLIEFTLDRLGKNRGFERQSVKVVGDANNPIVVEKKIDLSKLTLEEKLTLMKIAKTRMEEEAGDIIDAEEVEDKLLPEGEKLDECIVEEPV